MPQVMAQDLVVEVCEAVHLGLRVSIEKVSDGVGGQMHALLLHPRHGEHHKEYQAVGPGLPGGP